MALSNLCYLLILVCSIFNIKRIKVFLILNAQQILDKVCSGFSYSYIEKLFVTVILSETKKLNLYTPFNVDASHSSYLITTDSNNYLIQEGTRYRLVYILLLCHAGKKQEGEFRVVSLSCSPKWGWNIIIAWNGKEGMRISGYNYIHVLLLV